MDMITFEIGILIDRPVETEGFTMKDRETLMEQLHGIILRNFSLISQIESK